MQLAGWSILPRIGTKFLLQIYYTMASQPSDPNLLQKHSRVAYIIIISSYLLYLVIQAEMKLDRNFYHLLLSNPNDYGQLKQMYRKLSLNYHPDKNPGYETLFIQIQGAYEVLKDPLKQRVYDLFGASMLVCENCRTFSDYQRNYVSSLYGYYIGSAVTVRIAY